MAEQLFDWILAILGSGGLGATITYILTIKSRRTLEHAAAESALTDAASKKQLLKLDQYEYLQKTCDKYIREYHELEADFRRQMSEISDLMAKLLIEKSTVIQNKCNEVADLKSKLTYYKGIRCYDFTCPNRMKENPDKNKE